MIVRADPPSKFVYLNAYDRTDRIGRHIQNEQY